MPLQFMKLMMCANCTNRHVSFGDTLEQKDYDIFFFYTIIKLVTVKYFIEIGTEIVEFLITF